MRKPELGLASSSRGFTLIELMIVVTIIGLIAAIAIPNYQRHREHAKVGRTAQELRGLSNGFYGYLAAYQTWPLDSHLTLPPGMDEFINPQIWLDETPLGGHYNWEGYDTYPYVGLALFDSRATPGQLALLDNMLDNGDLNTGNFRLGTGGRPTLILEE